MTFCRSRYTDVKSRSMMLPRRMPTQKASTSDAVLALEDRVDVGDDDDDDDEGVDDENAAADDAVPLTLALPHLAAGSQVRSPEKRKQLLS